MHELRKAKIIVSGSNAKLLSKELSTLLTGRHLDLTVFPLSFTEFLFFRGIEINDDIYTILREIEIKSLLREYIEFGSFPEVVLNYEKREILFRYYDDVLNKDLIQRFKIRKKEALKNVARYFFANISNLVTFNSIERFIKVTADTIEKFYSYFEDAYLIFLINRFSYKLKEQNKRQKKVYSIDTGLVNTIGFRFRENTGKLMENIVFLELKRKTFLSGDLEIFYWKDEKHKEVNFIIKENTKPTTLIQVSKNC